MSLFLKIAAFIKVSTTVTLIATGFIRHRLTTGTLQAQNGQNDPGSRQSCRDNSQGDTLIWQTLHKHVLVTNNKGVHSVFFGNARHHTLANHSSLLFLNNVKLVMGGPVECLDVECLAKWSWIYLQVTHYSYDSMILEHAIDRSVFGTLANAKYSCISCTTKIDSIESSCYGRWLYCTQSLEQFDLKSSFWIPIPAHVSWIRSCAIVVLTSSAHKEVKWLKLNWHKQYALYLTHYTAETSEKHQSYRFITFTPGRKNRLDFVV